MMALRVRRSVSSSPLLRTLMILLSLLCLCFQLQLASAHGGIDDGDITAPPPPAADPSSVHDQLRSRGLIAVKAWCLVILLVSTFAGGVSPYFYCWNEAFLLLGTQFAAGVFLGTALMHFLADSTSTFRGLLPHNHYPFSYMLTCAGFLLTMLADLAIGAVTTRTRRRGHHAAAAATAVVNEAAAGEQGESKEEGSEHPMVVARTASFEDAVLLVFALCFHSVFEGIAVGVSATEGDAWRSLWTIGLHKVFAAVAMGIALLRMVPKRPFLTTAAYALAFAASSPVGVGIGIGIDATAEGTAADWTYAISMGLATGVFLYVAINHLVAKGYRPQQPTRADTPGFRFLALLLGAAVMAVVMIWD